MYMRTLKGSEIVDFKGKAKDSFFVSKMLPSGGSGKKLRLKPENDLS